tara:strand:- start:577 stop:1008 length:432 start_codon:yes stop_codon:yes gene_type:complete
MLFNEKLINKLPDDIIDYIYKKIYYKQNSEILEEIKLMYYINKKIITYNNIKDVCSCALIHMKDDIFIERIKIKDINNINNYIRDLNNDEVKILTNKTLSKAPLKKKYSFIFYMTDVTIHGKNYINDNFIKHYVNNLVKNLID